MFPPQFPGVYAKAPSDMQRIDDLIQFIADGYINQLAISQDSWAKHFLTSYGGFGFAHILRNVVPVLRGKGVTEEQIRTLLVENPKRILTFVNAQE